jgi:hypothetical protein
MELLWNYYGTGTCMYDVIYGIRMDLGTTSLRNALCGDRTSADAVIQYFSLSGRPRIGGPMGGRTLWSLQEDPARERVYLLGGPQLS